MGERVMASGRDVTIAAFREMAAAADHDARAVRSGEVSLDNLSELLASMLDAHRAICGVVVYLLNHIEELENR